MSQQHADLQMESNTQIGRNTHPKPGPAWHLSKGGHPYLSKGKSPIIFIWVTCLGAICPQGTASCLKPDVRSLPQLFPKAMSTPALCVPLSLSPFLNHVKLESRACPTAIWTEALTMQNARSEADRYLLYPDCKLNVCTNSIQET